jgi:hypothetical protein
VITGPVSVVAQDPHELGRKLRRNSVSRTGPRAGQRGS